MRVPSAAACVRHLARLNLSDRDRASYRRTIDVFLTSEYRERSNKAISEAAGVSQHLVAKVRREFGFPLPEMPLSSDGVRRRARFGSNKRGDVRMHASAFYPGATTLRDLLNGKGISKLSVEAAERWAASFSTLAEQLRQHVRSKKKGR